MKKLFALIVLLLAASACFAASSRLYDSNSYEFQTVRRLCLLSGVLGPTNASPMTESELYHAYLTIEPSKLNNRNYDEYIEIGKIFEDVEMDLDIVVNINPFIYKTGMQDELDNEEFIMPYRNMPSFLNYGLTAAYSDYGYLEMYFEDCNDEKVNFYNENGQFLKHDKTVYNSSFEYLLHFSDGKVQTSKNGNKPVDKYGHTPSIARGAISGDYISLIMGRTKQSFGAGYTGNILISDNFRFQEMLQLAFYNSKFNYRLNITHFDAQNPDGSHVGGIFSGDQTNRIVHRLQFEPFKNFRAAVNLAIVMTSTSGFDIRFLTPMMFVHNWYNFNETIEINRYDEANNGMVVEVETMPLPGLRINGQFMLDQIAQPGETTAVVPNAMGFLANISYVDSYKNFDAEYFAEGFYSTPSLYLNKKRNGSEVDWNRDWIVGYGRVMGENHYSGHPYGPDTLMAAFGAIFDFTEINVKSKNIVEWKKSGEQTKVMNTEFINEGKTPTGVAETRISLRSYNEWQATDNLSVNLNLGISFYENFGYEEGVEKTIPQLAFGLKWTIL